MGVELQAIKFNHDPGSAAGDALNIRRNATRFVDIPEWRRGVSERPEDSVAAYAVDEIRNNPVTVQVRLARTDSLPPSVEVRALQPPLPWAWLWAAYTSGNVALWHFVLETHVNVLGEVRTREVTFGSDGSTGFETFELQNHRLPSCGVGLHRVEWHWQYRTGPAAPWIDFERTTHQIYTVLEAPTEPWLQQPYDNRNLELPWTEVLDHACRWARRARTQAAAAALVTHNVYDLGRRNVLEYGCPLLAPTVYAFPYFRCTEFLKRLKGDVGLGEFCNCTDCATIVSTFSNALGCDLSQSRMQTFGAAFPVNPIRAIGLANWDTPCGLGFFGYHEVAWTGACTENDAVFDACLEVDSTAPPHLPFTPLLPANVRFGGSGEGLYRDLLAAPWGRHLCDPQPLTRQRRRVVPGPPRLVGRAALEEPADHLMRSFAFDAWAGSSRLDENLFVWRFGLKGDELPGWLIREADEMSAPGAYLAIQSMWQPSDDAAGRAVRVDVYECSSRLAAHTFLLRVLAEFQLPGVVRSGPAAPGDVAFTLPGDTGIVFSRANLVFRVLNAGRNLVPTQEVARTLDAQVVSKPEQSARAEIIPEWDRVKNAEATLRVGASLHLLRDLPDPTSLRAFVRAGAAAAPPEAPATPPGAAAALPDAPATPPLESPAGLKFFSRKGTFRLEDGVPVYEPEERGMHRITVVATPSHQNLLMQDLTLTVDEEPPT